MIGTRTCIITSLLLRWMWKEREHRKSMASATLINKTQLVNWHKTDYRNKTHLLKKLDSNTNCDNKRLSYNRGHCSRKLDTRSEFKLESAFTIESTFSTQNTTSLTSRSSEIFGTKSGKALRGRVWRYCIFLPIVEAHHTWSWRGHPGMKLVGSLRRYS